MKKDKICCQQKYMYEELNRVKKSAHKMYISILYLNLQIKNFSRSYSSCIHIKNILKNQERTAAITIAAFIHIYIHTISMFLFSGHWCPPTWVRKELDKVEEKWKNEQVDRRNKRRNITTHTYICIYNEKKKVI